MIETQKKSRDRVTVKVIGTAVALALVLYLLWRQGWGEISAVVSQISFGVFALTYLMTLMSRTAVGLRWHILLRSAGVKISAFRSISLTYAGLFASNFLPTTVGGDVVRLAGVMRRNLDRPVCLASLVVDRLVGMAGMALAIPLILLGLPEGLSLVAKAPLMAGAPVLGKLDTPLAGKAKRFIGKGLRLFKRLVGSPVILGQAPALPVCGPPDVLDTYAAAIWNSIDTTACHGRAGLLFVNRGVVGSLIFRYLAANIHQWPGSPGAVSDLLIYSICRYQRAKRTNTGVLDPYPANVCQSTRSFLPSGCSRW
jgi:hypothetical protein